MSSILALLYHKRSTPQYMRSTDSPLDFPFSLRDSPQSTPADPQFLQDFRTLALTRRTA